MARTGINAELLKIASSPPDWLIQLPKVDANESPYFLNQYLEEIESFMDATTDSVRLVRASRVSRRLLAKYDLEELEDLRAKVQASELLRVIPYPRQTDHSAHTLYLFLLGVYLFLCCQPLRNGIATFLKESDKSSKLLERFLFQWAFVSLLHDIGYVFQGRSRTEIRAVDRMFRAATVTRTIGNDADSNVRRAASDLINKLPPISLESIQNPEDILGALNYLPWGRYAGFCDEIFESFTVYASRDQRIGGESLEEYAYLVASSGYDGQSEGVVDHAIASGLFLFRYSTFWYWLAKETRYKDMFAEYMDGGYPEKDVVQACFATAGHNLIGVHAAKYGPLIFEENPIMYLGVLCDELQKWDRFPAGEGYLINLSEFENYCTDSERINVTGQWDGSKVTFEFATSALAVKVKKSLERLAAVDKFIEVKPWEEEVDKHC